MAIIEKKILFEGSKGKDEIEALFDSGATYSCIRKEIAQQLEIITPLPRILKFDTAKDGQQLSAKECIRCDFYINGDRFSDEFIVIEKLKDKVIIGAATLQKWRMKLDFEHDTIIYDPKVTRLRIV